MDEKQTGQNISRAFRVVQTTCRQASTMFSQLDEMFAERSLYPTRSITIGINSTARIGKADNWLPMALFRAYTRSEEDSNEQQDSFVAIEVQFAFEDLNEPAIVIAAVRAGELISSSQIWSWWHGFICASFVGETDLLDASVLKLSEKERKRLFDNAVDARAFRIPLCKLTDSNISKMVVEPACKMMQSLASS